MFLKVYLYYILYHSFTFWHSELWVSLSAAETHSASRVEQTMALKSYPFYMTPNTKVYKQQQHIRTHEECKT